MSYNGIVEHVRTLFHKVTSQRNLPHADFVAILCAHEEGGCRSGLTKSLTTKTTINEVRSIKVAASWSYVSFVNTRVNEDPEQLCTMGIHQ